MAGPLYRQIADQLRRMIESGDLKAGMQIPTEEQLMEQFRASRNTVRGALRELTTRGLVYTLHGKGTYVSEPVAPIVITLTSDPETGRGGGEGLVYTAEVAASGRKPEMRELEVAIRRAKPAIARSLGIPEEAEVICRRQNDYVDGLRWSWQTSYYPRSLENRAPRLLDTRDIGEGSVGYLGEVGIRQVGYQDSIEWRTPDEEDTAYFDLPPTATSRWSRSGASPSTRTRTASASLLPSTGPTGTDSSSTTAPFRAASSTRNSA